MIHAGFLATPKLIGKSHRVLAALINHMTRMIPASIISADASPMTYAESLGIHNELAVPDQNEHPLAIN